VNGALLDSDSAVFSKKAGHKLIVISRDVNDSSAFPSCPEYFLNDIAVRLRPVNSPLERPNIDEIAYNVEGLKLIGFQKV
jgi:hypothetical protein